MLGGTCPYFQKGDNTMMLLSPHFVGKYLEKNPVILALKPKVDDACNALEQ